MLQLHNHRVVCLTPAGAITHDAHACENQMNKIQLNLVLALQNTGIYSAISNYVIVKRKKYILLVYYLKNNTRYIQFFAYRGRKTEHN